MGEIEKTVVRGYPVEKLPDDLREGIADGRTVRVTIECEPQAERGAQRTMRSFLGAAPGLYRSPEDAVEFIRSLRDESDR